MKKMFKKILALSLITIVFVSGFCINSQAETIDNSIEEFVVVKENIELLDNGITITTTITERVLKTTDRNPSKAATYTKTGKATQTAKNGSTTLFSFTVHGTFTVNPGISATCTSSSYSHSITESAWSLDSASASKSGNKASASGTFKKKLLFITVDTMTLNLTLTCNANGVLS